MNEREEVKVTEEMKKKMLYEEKRGRTEMEKAGKKKP